MKKFLDVLANSNLRKALGPDNIYDKILDSCFNE